ncbi:M14 family metallopeptidase [Bradyrhizobium iriomotense]|uniref:Peptidase M14 domain-containing protein n=1 Tax=Bradyrhizobium iriomotense TaxID=441950 RepID=A0ABQ6BD86_9BRAD|nr:M14 family metallocarboxypeptidase [Bradyrhizobium iriomotense]GLR90107.1 hypothetical protein GCM10007857_68210 [Bradyrhizobium iriomotense]
MRSGWIWLGSSLTGLALLVSPATAQFDPAKAYEEAPAVAARYPDPGVDYDTPALAPGRTGFTGHAEMMAYLSALQAKSSVMTMKIAGRSQQGRELPLLIFGSMAPTRPVVLLIGQQHGNEHAGGEAMLALARRLADGDLAPLLDRITVLIVPRANPDGAAADKRALADGVDLNRDHTLLRSPEGQALGAIFRDYQPNIVLDCHEFTVASRWVDKFGGLQRIDAMLQYATTANLPDMFVELQQNFRNSIMAALDSAGLTQDWYYTTGRAGGPAVASMGGIGADTGRNVAALRNAVSFLVETRGVGIGLAHFRRRVHTHVTAAQAILQAAADNPAGVLAAVARSREVVSGLSGSGNFVVLSKQTPEKRVLTFVDPVTGADKPIEVDWNSSLKIIPALTRSRPAGYLLAASEGAAAAKLRDLGLIVQQISAKADVSGETYRTVSVHESGKEDVTGSDEGAGKILLGEFATEGTTVKANAGDYYVSMAQPLANLAGIELEPESPVGFVANRLIAIPAGGTIATARLSAAPPALKAWDGK